VRGYDNEESIDRDTVMLSPGESDIDDDDLCDISSNFIAEAADLSHHRSPLPSLEDVLAQEERTTSGVRLAVPTDQPEIQLGRVVNGS